MEYTETEIEGVWIIQPKVFNDARGYFFEAWKQAEFDEHIGHHVEFIQDNESKSSFGVLRSSLFLVALPMDSLCSVKRLFLLIRLITSMHRSMRLVSGGMMKP